MKPLIFLSYSSKDKLIADAICSRLENQGIRCWIAPRDVHPGADYSNQIADALEAATTMVMVFSSDSNNSRHVKSEIDRAFSLGKIIIPFRVENVELDKGLAYYLAKTHWLDAVTKPLEQHIDRLAVTIRQISGTEEPEISERPPPPPAPLPPPPPPMVPPVVIPPAAPAAASKMPWIIAGLVVFCGMLLSAALLFLWLNQPKSGPPAPSKSSAASTALAPPSSAPTATPVTKKTADVSSETVEDDDQFEGTWTITDAETLTGNPYTGTVRVRKNGDRYEVAWRSTASTASGIGLASGNKLCVGWGTSDFGVMFYKIGADGTLRGRWAAHGMSSATSDGLENASGGSPTDIEGDYAVKGSNPGGATGYEGKLRIQKTGETYQLKWRVGDRVTTGIGIRLEDTLCVAWGKEGFGVVGYILEGREATGRWTLGGAAQTAPENWTR